MIEVIEQTADRAKLDHDLIVPITNPDTTNKCGQTPLLWAAQNGHVEVVRRFLERKDVNPDTANEQCSQRGSPSVWSQDEDGRLFVVPSCPPDKLPGHSE